MRMRKILCVGLCLLASSALHAQTYYRIALSDKLNRDENALLINMNERAIEEKTFFEQLAYEDPFIRRFPNMVAGKPLSTGIPYGVDKLNSTPIKVSFDIKNAYSGNLLDSANGAEISYSRLPQGIKSALYMTAKHGGRWRFYIPSRLLEMSSHQGEFKANEPVEVTLELIDTP